MLSSDDNIPPQWQAVPALLRQGGPEVPGSTTVHHRLATTRHAARRRPGHITRPRRAAACRLGVRPPSVRRTCSTPAGPAAPRPPRHTLPEVRRVGAPLRPVTLGSAAPTRHGTEWRDRHRPDTAARTLLPILIHTAPKCLPITRTIPSISRPFPAPPRTPRCAILTRAPSRPDAPPRPGGPGDPRI